MAGICITDIVCDLLNFAVTAHKQQFFCLGDPVTGQIFIDRAPKIAHKQARQILGGYIDVAAELFGGQILHVVCFYQPKHGLDVFFPRRIAGVGVEKSIGKLQQQCITVAGKLVCIDWCCFKTCYSTVDHSFDFQSIFLFCKIMRLLPRICGRCASIVPPNVAKHVIHAEVSAAR